MKIEFESWTTFLRLSGPKSHKHQLQSSFDCMCENKNQYCSESLKIWSERFTFKIEFTNGPTPGWLYQVWIDRIWHIADSYDINCVGVFFQAGVHFPSKNNAKGKGILFCEVYTENLKAIPEILHWFVDWKYEIHHPTTKYAIPTLNRYAIAYHIYAIAYQCHEHDSITGGLASETPPISLLFIHDAIVMRMKNKFCRNWIDFQFWSHI